LHKDVLKNESNTKLNEMEKGKFDLEDRLADYTCRMIDVVEALPATRAGNYIAVS
jgi:hypothetical protein